MEIAQKLKEKWKMILIIIFFISILAIIYTAYSYNESEKMYCEPKDTRQISECPYYSVVEYVCCYSYADENGNREKMSFSNGLCEACNHKTYDKFDVEYCIKGYCEGYV